MKTFKVVISRKVFYEIPVKAESQKEAEKKVRLGEADWAGAWEVAGNEDFRVIPDKEEK